MFDIFYPWIKAIHLTAVIFWMAGLLYLPRLFVYHSAAEIGGELERQMEEAEVRLLRIIMNVAMIVAFLMGLTLLIVYPQPISIWVKAVLALGLIGYHGFLAKTRKNFLNGGRPKSEKFFRIINELPPIVTIIIVILAIVKPF